MITRIEIDGFKSFHNFSVALRPFQVLIGPNGAGKSNLFDAIVLLSNLADDNTLYEAFRNSRGEVGELFTIYPDGKRAKTMRFAVEMLIGKTITDTFNVTADVSSTRLRYELTIEGRPEQGFERLYVAHERLDAIIGENDKWFKPNIPAHVQKSWIRRGRRSAYISTEKGIIHKHQDRRSGRKQETPLGHIERTVLSTINNAEYPTAYAVRQEMLSWRFLQFNPMELRTPSDVYASDELLSDGSNLAAVLYRMSRNNEFALIDVSRDMANIVPGILEVLVEALREREEFLVKARTTDGSVFSSRILSDGTLRLLALVTLKNDPRHRGVLCFEEPENGVHALRLQRIVNVLKSLAADFEVDEDIPKQILINTHSPLLLSHVAENDLLFVYMPGRQPRETRMAPVTSQGALPTIEIEDEQERRFTLDEVKRYLDPSSLYDKFQKLEELEFSL